MKKVISIILALVIAMTLTTVAFADGTTTLTTTVPFATYTLNIPADQTIEFGTTTKEIGTLTVSDSSGFASGKNLKVTVAYSAFTSSSVNTTIPFKVVANTTSKTYDIPSGTYLVFSGSSSGSALTTPHHPDDVNHSTVNGIGIQVKSADWGKALGGDYAATITFTSEVVSG